MILNENLDDPSPGSRAILNTPSMMSGAASRRSYYSLVLTLPVARVTRDTTLPVPTCSSTGIVTVVYLWSTPSSEPLQEVRYGTP